MSSTIVIVKPRAVKAVRVGGISGPAGPAGSSFVSKTITADAAAISNDMILADATAASITITFASPQTDDQIIATKTDSSANTVTIPGGIVLNYQNSSAHLIYAGGSWRVI